MPTRKPVTFEMVTKWNSIFKQIQQDLNECTCISALISFSVPSMALILLVKVQSRVFTAKCSEPQVGTSNGMDEGSGVTKFLSLRTET